MLISGHLQLTDKFIFPGKTLVKFLLTLQIANRQLVDTPISGHIFHLRNYDFALFFSLKWTKTKYNKYFIFYMLFYSKHQFFQILTNFYIFVDFGFHPLNSFSMPVQPEILYKLLYLCLKITT